MSMTKRVLVSALLAALTSHSEGTNAYIYYSDAECIDSYTISGTFNLGYDSSSFRGFGKSIENYEGGCIYLDGGYLDLNYYTSAQDSMSYGYCVTCNGVASCSSDKSCDNVASINSGNLYQMSEESANSYQKTEVYPQPFKYAQDVNAMAMKMIGNQSSGLSSAWYAVIGGCIGFVSLFGLLAALEGHRKYRMRRSASDLAQSFAEDV